MKVGKINAALLLGITLIANSVAPSSAAATKPGVREVSLQLRELREADWLQQDSGFSLAQTQEVIRRGLRLAERLPARA